MVLDSNTKSSSSEGIKDGESQRGKIAIIGAGFAGICAAAKLKRGLGCHDFTIIDQNQDFGGVWIANKYPGCATDVFGHFYSLSFHPNPDWSQGYVPQPEVLRYLQNLALAYGLYEHALFGTRVERAEWDEREGTWKMTVITTTPQQRRESDRAIHHDTHSLETESRSTLRFNFIINGQGRFSSPHIPDQFLSFENPLLHTARWEVGLDLRGKSVAVVGTGSTAAQLIPKLVNDTGVKNLTVFMRQPPYIVPASNVTYSKWTRAAFRFLPFVQWLYRLYLFFSVEKYFRFFALGSKFNAAGKAFCHYSLKQEVKDEELAAKLTPTYEFGCKRIIPSGDFYAALTNPKVTVIKDPIERVGPNYLVTKGGTTVEGIDILVMATGFRVQDTYTSFPIIGKDGVDVGKKWVEDRPSAYLGIITSDAPNHFFLLGPNTSTGYSSVLFPLECQVTWVMQVLGKALASQSKKVKVSAELEQSYMTNLHSDMLKKIYVHPSCGSCNSWMRNPSGIVTEIYPGTNFSYWKKTYWLRNQELSFTK